jgi:hypothetical protein
MLLHIFASQGPSAERNGTLVYVGEDAQSLPPHAAGGEWRYVATMSDADSGLANIRKSVLAGIAQHGFYLSARRRPRP